MAWCAAGVIAIAIMIVNWPTAPLFLSDARYAHRRGCNSRTPCLAMAPSS